MGIRGGEVKTYPSVRNVLLLIKLNEKLIEKFFQDGLASFQKRIGSVYQIRWYPPEEVIGIVNEEGGVKELSRLFAENFPGIGDPIFSRFSLWEKEESLPSFVQWPLPRLWHRSSFC